MAGYEEDSETECPGFSWDRDDFLYSVWHDAVFLLQEKNILIKQQYFSCCWAVLHRAKNKGKRAQGAGETEPEQLTWTGQRDIPHHMT